MLYLHQRIAGAGIDYVANQLVAFITSTTVSQCLSITINDDVIVEGDQDFTVTLTLIDDDLESPNTNVPVTIVDNDGTVSSTSTLLM